MGAEPPMKSLRSPPRMASHSRTRRTVRTRTTRAALQPIAEQGNCIVAPSPRLGTSVTPQPRDVAMARLGGALFAGTCACLIVGLLGWKAFDLSVIPSGDYKIFLTIMLAKALATLALTYLAYSLFGAAERLLLPSSLIQGGSSQVPLVRVLLGIRTPLNAAQSAAKGLSDGLLGYAKSAVPKETMKSEAKGIGEAKAD